MDSFSDLIRGRVMAGCLCLALAPALAAAEVPGKLADIQYQDTGWGSR